MITLHLNSDLANVSSRGDEPYFSEHLSGMCSKASIDYLTHTSKYQSLTIVEPMSLRPHGVGFAFSKETTTPQFRHAVNTKLASVLARPSTDDLVTRVRLRTAQS
jgi:hypothetical protein